MQQPLYNDGFVTVTPSTIATKKSTYKLADVKGARYEIAQPEHKRREWWANLLLGVAPVIMLVGWVVGFASGYGLLITLFCIFGCFVWLFSYLLRRACVDLVDFNIYLGTTFGEVLFHSDQRACGRYSEAAKENETRCQNVVKAINEAMQRSLPGAEGVGS